MARAGRGFFDLLGFVARAAPVLVLLISIAAPAFTAPPGARIAHSSQSLAVPVHACQGSFVSHSLPHTTVISDERERIFAGMGAALGLGDLDNDADIDIVLGNLDAPATILWNEGQLAFRKQPLAQLRDGRGGGVRARGTLRRLACAQRDGVGRPRPRRRPGYGWGQL